MELLCSLCLILSLLSLLSLSLLSLLLVVVVAVVVVVVVLLLLLLLLWRHRKLHIGELQGHRRRPSTHARALGKAEFSLLQIYFKDTERPLKI